MRKLLLIPFLLICVFVHGQTEEIIPDNKSQIKIVSSIEYKKIPFAMRMLKKQLPKENTNYYSNIGARQEVNMEIKMFGEHMTTSQTSVSNYTLGKKWSKQLAIVNDSIMQDDFQAKDIETPDNDDNNVVIGKETKEILGYPCVAFSVETDSAKIEGFLAPGILGHGKFKNHGMPLELKMTAKTEKLVTVTTAKSIDIEPLNSDLFKLEED